MEARYDQANRRISYIRWSADQRDALIDFIAADTYPYNGVPEPTGEQIASWIDKGLYAETFWITLNGITRVGVVQYQDASSIHAEVHIRIAYALSGPGNRHRCNLMAYRLSL